MSHRSDFIRRVAATFRGSRLTFAFLHGSRPDHVRDSDVDVALDRGSLRAADSIIRTGSFGRLMRVVQYDIPWCRTYTLEVGELGRRFRQLDISCDPWGVNRFGSVLQSAVESGSRNHDDVVPRPEPGIEAAYLTVKRAVERRWDQAALRELTDEVRRAPESARAFLVETYGAVGGAVIDELCVEESDEREVVTALAALRQSVERRRRQPALLVRRAAFAGWRAIRRATVPTGLSVYVAGPDGVGKSTLSAGLETETLGLFARVVRAHAGPGFLPPPGHVLRRDAPPADRPHDRPPTGLGTSLLRLTYLWVDHQLFWWLKVWPARVRSSLVVVERGWSDVIVDPARYRIAAPSSLVRGLFRLLPRPDVVLVLDAPAELVHGRKPEIEVDEVARQLAHWHELVSQNNGRYVTLDASRPTVEVAARAADEIATRLSARHATLEDCELALRCLGAIVSSGTPYAVVGRPQRPRWLLPLEGRKGGPQRWRLYRPADRRRAIGAALLELLNWSHADSLVRRVEVDPRDGLAPLLARALGVAEVEVASSATGDARRGKRALVSVRSAGEVVAFAKVAEDGRKLVLEGRVLEVLARIKPRSFVVPTVVDQFEWRGATVLLLAAASSTGRANRPMGEPELRALAELGGLSDALRPVIGIGEHQNGVPVHGDFAPWNSSLDSSGRVTLWDWEETRMGLPLEDYFHWEFQRLLRFGSGDARSLVMEALSGTGRVRYACRRLGVDPALAPVCFRAYLESSLEDASLVGPDVDIRREALGLLSSPPADFASIAE